MVDPFARKSVEIADSGNSRAPEHPGGVECRAEDHGLADRPAVGRLPRRHAEDRGVEGGFLAPVERRMGIEDLQAAEDQDEDADRIDPVGEADENAMAIDQPGPTGRRDWGR